MYDSPDLSRSLPDAVLAAYPEALARANHQVNDDGTPNDPAVVRDCKGTTCAYYQYLQGTSMAAPHAVGVAALVVAAHGAKDKVHGGLTLSPRKTTRYLYDTATEVACPQPRTFHYTRYTPQDGIVESDARCSGPRGDNGFYGHGIVDAYAAVS